MANNEKPFVPYIKAGETIPEFTIRAVLLGSILAAVFGLANAYLGLKLGMTVSASIPAAVISMAILRGILRRGTVLENNIVQTIGSSGESLAAGVIFTIPAFLIWRDTIPGFDFHMTNIDIIVLSLLGGGLGILFMIPLRRYLIVREHGRLPYPEGTACAEILIAGDEGGSKAKTVFIGVGLAGLYKLLMSGVKLWKEVPTWDLKWIKGASLGIDATPALLGVGYIIGPRIASLMMAGAALGYLAIAPLLAFVGTAAPDLVLPPAVEALSALDPAGIRNHYIKYIGAGAVAFGGLVSLVKAIPVIVTSFGLGIREVAGGAGARRGDLPRTERDIPMVWVLVGAVLFALGVWLYPNSNLSLLGAAMVVLFSFFFVTVASRIVGIVGSSSSPVSGMTIATLLVTCLVFSAAGKTGIPGMIAAMTVGTIVCIAICMAGDASQDLKTGFLVGATPIRQQIAEFIGVVVPALFIGLAVYFFDRVYGFTGEGALEAPQANVMAMVVRGVMTHSIPWMLVIVGAMVALAVELLGISSLPFAIGLYLPLNLSTPIMAGGLLYWASRKLSGESEWKPREETGILYFSGLVAGDALVGVLIAFAVAIPAIGRLWESVEEGFLLGAWADGVSLVVFAGLVLVSWVVVHAAVRKR